VSTSIPATSVMARPCPCGSGYQARYRAQRGGGLVCATCWSQGRASRPVTLDGTSEETLLATASQALALALQRGEAPAWHLVYALAFDEELVGEDEALAAEAFAQRLLAHAYQHATAENPTAALIAALTRAGITKRGGS
jgi:hypothetical protein